MFAAAASNPAAAAISRNDSGIGPSASIAADAARRTSGNAMSRSRQSRKKCPKCAVVPSMYESPLSTTTGSASRGMHRSASGSKLNPPAVTQFHEWLYPPATRAPR